LNEFTQLVDLASEQLGGAVLAANDEFFAPRGNLIKPGKPIFVEDKYTDAGKWMDGWETRRRRTPGHDWCIIRLGLPGIVRGVVVDTSFFRGNFPSHCSIEACSADDATSVDHLSSTSCNWNEILAKSDLKGDSQNLFFVNDPRRFTHLRFNIFPDGGVARLRVHGEVLPDWPSLLANAGAIDLASVVHGGRPLQCSDMFYSAPRNLLMPFPAANMGDGWETKRRRGTGHDWAILKLGIPGAIERIEVDTHHFKGNYPESCSLDAYDVGESDSESLESLSWKELLPRTSLGANQLHVFQNELHKIPSVTHVRFNIFPDGGVSRLKLFGMPTKNGRTAAMIRCLNGLGNAGVEAALMNCCGSSAWVRDVMSRGQFAGAEQLLKAAENAFAQLKKEDWLEAFRHHPRIGEKKSDAPGSATAQKWSAKEQSGISGANGDIMAELSVANRDYETRFGHIFIVCASGKSGGEMIQLLRARLNNSPDAEIKIAAEEQRKITRLRLESLLGI
jgi:allantoicase